MWIQTTKFLNHIFKMSGPVFLTTEYEDEDEGYDKGDDIWWYCWRWWSREVSTMKFPNFGYKVSGPLSPPISLWWFLFIFKKNYRWPKILQHSSNLVIYTIVRCTKYEIIDFCWRHPMKRDLKFTSSCVERLSLGSKNIHQWWGTS